MMFEKVDISVILPVYNSEETLQRCINSILNQDGVTLELIVIDDGSIDKSAEIISEIAKKNGNVIYLYQNNSGPNFARSVGLSHAIGEFVTFVDSDDELLPGMYSKMLDFAKKARLDVVCCGYIRKTEQVSISSSVTEEDRVVAPEDYLSDSLNSPLGGYMWNRAYKRGCFRDGFLDCDLSIGEDLVENCWVWRRIQSVGYISGCYYVYNDYGNSLSRGEDRYISKNGEYVLRLLNDKLESVLPESDCVSEELAKRKIQQYFGGIRILSGKRNCREERKKLKRYCWSHLNDYRKTKPPLRSCLINALTMILPEKVIAAIMSHF